MEVRRMPAPTSVLLTTLWLRPIRMSVSYAGRTAGGGEWLTVGHDVRDGSRPTYLEAQNNWPRCNP